jgi:rhodanese-related sulfurtransferase
MSVQLPPAEFAEKLKGSPPPRILDVREQEEYQFVHLPDSKLIPLGELLERVGELDAWKDDEIVVYCHHGVRSLNAISQLRHFGFTRLRNLTGGIDRYSSEVDPSLPRY